MVEKVHKTRLGPIHYWISKDADVTNPELIFLPGLTADHRLFEKQIEYFEGKYPVFVWDAPGHSASYPFALTFCLTDKAQWLDEILQQEGFDHPIIIGQSMLSFLLICGTKDRAGSYIRYNKAWHKKTGIPIRWIQGAGHNSNTDAPDVINRLIDAMAKRSHGSELS